MLGLPFSVWLLANFCALIDEPEPLPALVRSSLALCAVLILLLLTDTAFLYPLIVSFIIVVVLHVVSFLAMSKYGTGVPVYERIPPHPPLLDDALNVSDTDLDTLADEPQTH